MPQISKELLSDAMYCVNQYQNQLRFEQELLHPDSPRHIWVDGELAYASKIMAELRPLYEQPSGPRPPMGIDPNFKE